MSVSILDRGAGARTPLERCVGDVDEFLADAWGRRPSVRVAPPATAARTERFADLLTLDDVDRFLTTQALRTPAFRLVKAGDKVAESAYTRSGRMGSRDVAGIADPSKVAALFADGATIVLQGLHRWSEPVARFIRDLELQLGHPCQVNAYVTPPGAQGLDLHADPHDVFVLQAFGRKRWEVHAAPGEATSGERPALDVEVGPGDTMYMPMGTLHAAAAQEVASGHLTVGVHVTPWRDVLGDTWQALAADPALAGSVPAGWTGDLDGFTEELATRLELLAASLRDGLDARAVAERRLERFRSTRAQLARGTIAERAVPLAIDDDTEVVRRPDSICELRLHRRDDTLIALLGDRRLEMPARLEPAMRFVAETARTDEDSDGFRVGELPLPDAASRAVLARRLIREGLLARRVRA